MTSIRDSTSHGDGIPQRSGHRRHPFNLSRFILEDPAPPLECGENGDTVAINAELVSMNLLRTHVLGQLYRSVTET